MVMATSEKFCLRWNEFESNISSAFRELRDDKDFFDVTLACDDEQIHAHKVILSACSPFFRNILRRNPHHHPLLYLKGVKYTDLQSVLNFMYHGEVSIAQEELNSFLAVAEDLRVKGLTQSPPSTQNTRRESNHKPSSNFKTVPHPLERLFEPPSLNRARPAPLPCDAFATTSAVDDGDDIQDVVSVKSEPRDPTPCPVVPTTPAYPQPAPPSYTQQSQALATPDDQTMAYQEESYDDYQYEEQEQIVADNGDIESLMAKLEDGTGHLCLICNKVSAMKHNLKKHILTMHLQDEPQDCMLCGRQFKNKNTLQNHMSLSHRGK